MKHKTDENGWISVLDSLPGDDIDENKVEMCFGEPSFGTACPEADMGYLDEEGIWRFWLNDREVQGFGVTHWRIINSKMPKVFDTILDQEEQKARAYKLAGK